MLFFNHHLYLFRTIGGSWIVNLILLGQCGLKEDQRPSSLAAKSRSRKRKTVDGDVGDVEGKYNAKNLEH